MRDFQTTLESNAKCAIAIAHNNRGDLKQRRGDLRGASVDFEAALYTMQAMQLLRQQAIDNKGSCNRTRQFQWRTATIATRNLGIHISDPTREQLLELITQE